MTLKVAELWEAEGRAVWQTKATCALLSATGSFHDPEGTQPWAWHTVGLLGWKLPLLFLGNLGRTRLTLKDPGRCPQRNGLCGCRPGLLAGWANRRWPLGHPPCRPATLDRGLSQCVGSPARGSGGCRHPVPWGLVRFPGHHALSVCVILGACGPWAHQGLGRASAGYTNTSPPSSGL